RNEIGSSMKTRTLIQTMEREASSSAFEVSSHSSALVGVTVLGNLEDVLAVLRSAMVLTRNLRTTLFLGLPGKDVSPVRFEEASYSAFVAELLTFVGAQLRRLDVPAFAME